MKNYSISTVYELKNIMVQFKENGLLESRASEIIADRIAMLYILDLDDENSAQFWLERKYLK